MTLSASAKEVPYFISAGEPSGDLLGGDLVQALQELWPQAKPFGVAGPVMRQAGVQPFAGIEDLSVMGFVEVLRQFFHLKQLENELLARIDRLRPRFAILIDYPGFHLRLAEQLKMRGIPVYQYVAPQLWAWGEKRTERLKAVTDHVFGIMPFERDFFERRGVAYTYVGTPQVDRAGQAQREPKNFGFTEQSLTVGLFPGSRRGEVSRTLPMMRAVMESIRSQDPTVEFAISMAPHLNWDFFAGQLAIEDAATGDFYAQLERQGYVYIQEIGATIVRGSSLNLMASVGVALVTSGTATLECALVETPLSVFYKMNRISYILAKRLVRLPHISLVNLVAGHGIVKEFIQDFNADSIAKELLGLLKPGPRRQQAVADLRILRDKLQGQPGRHAARWILDQFQSF